MSATGQPSAKRPIGAFTLVEMILVMTLLCIAVAMAAPSMGGFFKGRKQDYEARRILSLIREGQSRAVAEGVPVWLWFDVKANGYGLEEDPSFINEDPKAVQCDADPDVQVGIKEAARKMVAVYNGRNTLRTQGSLYVNLRGRSLPAIRFLPDGSIAEGSPAAVTVEQGKSSILYVAQADNGLSYEILNQNEAVRNTFR